VNDLSQKIEEIKRRTTLSSVIGRYVELKGRGGHFVGKCPFHNDKTPSFHVFDNDRSPHYHCYGGACDAHGDVFDFLTNYAGRTFTEVLLELAGPLGIELIELTSGKYKENKVKRERLFEVMEDALSFFVSVLHDSDAMEVRRYLKSRGVKSDAWTTFEIGCAKQGWNNLFLHLKNKGFTQSEMVDAGVVQLSKKSGAPYDVYRGRLMFPIRDQDGKLVSFSGRIVPNYSTENGPKYLNGPATELFDKSKTFYGLHLAKAEIKKLGRVVIVEGNLDVVMAHQAGAVNTVATLGTALTESHFRTLAKLSKEIVLALDGDEAGAAATDKAIAISRDALTYERNFSEIEIKVATLPNGQDPAQVLSESPFNWQNMVDNALPVVDYYIIKAGHKYDLTSLRGKQEALAELIPALMQAGSVSQLHVQHYINRISTRLKIEPMIIKAFLTQRRAKSAAVSRSAESKKPSILKTEQGHESYLLAELVRYYRPGLVEKVVAKDGLAIRPSDFRNPLNRILFEGLMAGKPLADLDSESEAHLKEVMGLVANIPVIDYEEDLVKSLCYRLNNVRKKSLTILFDQIKEQVEIETGDGALSTNQEDVIQLLAKAQEVSQRIRIYSNAR
jgi:DNA primase catalytic core